MSEHRQPKPAEVIVTSDSVQGKRHTPKNLRFIVSGLIVLVLLVVAGALFYHYVYKSLPKSQIPTKAQNLSQLTPKEKLISAQTALKSASTASQKAAAYEDLAGAYLENNQANSAIISYQSAISADSSTKSQALAGLAYTYAIDGQKDQAIATYQELIALLQQQNQGQQGNPYTGTQSPIQTYQEAIQNLENGGYL